ncbi:MAG: hypothetical protein ABIR46_02015 [Candidatus Saccharimonadales bacterium]
MKRVLLYLSVLLTLLSGPMVRAEGDQPLTDENIASIKSGCTDALQGLLRVQKTEAATRVNRGREYESILKLAAAFNSRVVLNKLDAPLLISTTTKLQTEFNEFQTHYIDYADKVDATLEINCKQAPVTFYDSLTSARESRAVVAKDVGDMETLLNDYQRGLDELKTQLLKIEEIQP